MLIIPEERGRTYEFKVRRISVWICSILGAGVLVLLGLGLQAYIEAAYLDGRVTSLQHDKALLVEEVALMASLERKVLRLESRNVQYTRMLSGSVEVEEEHKESPSFNQYIPGIKRLRWGRVRTVPSLWPVRGVIKELHTADRPGVVIAAREGSLIRASAAGQVEKISFDESLGHVIVVDHGSGISTVYGHVATSLVEPGRYVHKGQPIALCGRAADGHGAVYFAVLENNESRDPLTYRLWL